MAASFLPISLREGMAAKMTLVGKMSRTLAKMEIIEFSFMEVGEETMSMTTVTFSPSALAFEATISKP